jgi:hypothetical protein
MLVDTGSFDFAGRIAGRDSPCFAQDDKFLEVGRHDRQLSEEKGEGAAKGHILVLR